MAVRVNPTEVKEIITTRLTDARVSTFITASNLVIDNNLLNEGMSDALLTELERWLSAHFICAEDARADTEKIGPVEVKYQSSNRGFNLDSTSFGQRVKLLDTSGILASAGKTKAYIEAVWKVLDSD